MLAPVYSQILQALALPPNEITLLPGPVVGHVIPDLLLAHWQPGASCYRGTITHLEALVLSHIEGGRSMSVEGLLKNVFLPRPKAQKIFSRLERMGLIGSVDRKNFSLRETASTENVEIIAIELKLSRWREALKQGKAYQDFADRSYVVIDATQISFSESIFAEFEAANVGLLLHDGKSLRSFIRCQSRSAQSAQRFLAAQKLKRCEYTATNAPRTLSILERLPAMQSDDAHQCRKHQLRAV
jgi:hypothetical protein